MINLINKRLFYRQCRHRIFTIIKIILLTLIIFSCERKWNNPYDEMGNHAIVTTTSINSITVNSAASGGNVTSDGGTSVTARGVCWSPLENPTITDGHTRDGTGIGSFTSNITGLMASTKYYVRAYATNSVGTSYGSQLNFTTIGLPTVTTTAISSITENSAVSGGNVTSGGGLTVTARGVCWNTSKNPQITDAHTTDGTGTGSFTSNLTGLVLNTTYYVRAYATNENGTSYGNEISFVACGTISDYDGNIYRIIPIGTQTWMAENLKVTHYPNGTTIPLVTGITDWANLIDNNTDDAYCYYMNSADSAAKYGALYTFAAAKDACPEGWHLPSNAEWKILNDYIAADGHSGSEGTALKATSGWLSDGNGTDDYGFSALPGGFRFCGGGTFGDAGIQGVWWSSTESAVYNTKACHYSLFKYSEIYSGSYGKSGGFSVRCVRD